MAEQGSKSISDIEITARTHAATEIFAGIIASTKEALEKGFGKPSSYYDGEKKNVLLIANTIFRWCVSPQDIERLVRDEPICNIVDITASIEKRDVDNGNMATTDPDCFSDDADDADEPFSPMQ